MIGPCFAVQYLMSFLVLQLSQRRREGGMLSSVFLMKFGCLCYGYVSLPHGAMGWCAMYDCGISLIYLLTV